MLPGQWKYPPKTRVLGNKFITVFVYQIKIQTSSKFSQLALVLSSWATGNDTSIPSHHLPEPIPLQFSRILLPLSALSKIQFPEPNVHQRYIRPFRVKQGLLPLLFCKPDPHGFRLTPTTGVSADLQSRFKMIASRASLVAQWLRICLLTQGTRVRALVWEDPTCHRATRPVSHNY